MTQKETVADLAEELILKRVGKWLRERMIATPIRGIEWRILLDEVETFERGEMPE